MADIQSGGPAVPTTSQLFTTQEKQAFLMWMLLGVGVILVAFSPGIGREAAQNCGPGANCSWSPEDAAQAAMISRGLGGMAFAAGLVERLAVCLRGAARGG